MSKVTLECFKDDVSTGEVEVDSDLALQSVTISNLIEDFGGLEMVEKIPLSNIDCAIVTNIFSHLSTWKGQTEVKDKDGSMKKFNEIATTDIREIPLQDWEKTFFDQMDMESRFNFILAANTLDIKPSLNAIAMYIASLIKGKTPEEIRSTFVVPQTAAVAQ